MKIYLHFINKIIRSEREDGYKSREEISFLKIYICLFNFCKGEHTQINEQKSFEL